MSRKEDSLSFLSSITLGTENNNVSPKKKENFLSKSSNSTFTTPKKEINTEPISVGKKRSQRTDVSKKRLGDSQTAMDFLRGISFGDEEEPTFKTHMEKRSQKTPEEEKNPPHRSVSKRDSGVIAPVEAEANTRLAFTSIYKTPKYTIRLSSGFPLLTSSLVIQEKPKRSTNIDHTVPEKSKQGISYGYLLDLASPTYDPNFLDHDIITPEKLKIAVNLPSYLSSILPFSDAKDAREETNAAFVDKHGWLESDISLSKIRSSKRKIADIASNQSIDPSCIALAYVYFEKLVLKNFVFKSNCKYVAPACLLLAVKYYGPRSQNYTPLLKEMELKFDVTPKEILQYEFHVYKALNFSLSAQTHEIMPHLKKIFVEVPLGTVS